VNKHASSTSAGGYTCPKCGAWVTNGYTHYCTGDTIQYTWSSSDTQLAMAMDKLAIAIEKLVKVIEERMPR
jgi:hypothetical protein